MIYKQEAENLLKQGSSLSDPMNFALHLCGELIREYTVISPDPDNVEYWEKVRNELLRIRESNSQLEK